MKIRMTVGMLSLAMCLLSTTVASAVPIIADARLDSAQEVAAGVASTSPAVGAAVLSVEPTTGEFDFSLQISGIDPSDLADLDLGAAISSIHLHNGTFGNNGPVVVDLGGGENNLNVTPFGNGGLSVNIDGGNFGGLAGSTLADSNANLALLFADSLYINVHTNDFQNGAIRGQLSLVQQVPEPTTMLMAGLSAIGAVALRRRRS